ncbi:Homologous recombination OB-fold protein [Frankliniella fusca]|uniref:Homologous recombination OB-fold protein n=1 Tax=Frankliniella fusca TaxID=407009 RepID=A0AAE1GVH9_9NEOP|nr:Homologous recombination OB-fold protein [Frankliniella fusca]
MFEDDDDFEIDEEFLDGVFDAEKTAIRNDDTLNTTRSSPENSLDCELESSPLRKRKTLPPRTTPPEHQKTSTAPILRTSAESARLIASVNQRQQLHESCSNSENLSEILRVDSHLQNHRIVSGSGRSPHLNQSENNRFKLPPQPCKRTSPPESEPRSTEISFNLNTSRARQRKFPGPAGLLPERGKVAQGQRSNFSSLLNVSGSDLDESEEPLSLCSQSTASVLEDGPWSALKADFSSDGQCLLKRYTVAWVKQRAAAKQLSGQKVPFLAAVLHSIDCSSPDPCVVLRDPTGEIPGTLHRSVWDSFGGQLIAGSALVLRFVGVLSTGISARRHYLNITSNNIVTIYSSPLCEPSLPDTTRVRKTDIHKWNLHQLMQAANSWEEQCKRKKNLSTNNSVSSFSRNMNLNSSGNNSPRPQPVSFRSPAPIHNQSSSMTSSYSRPSTSSFSNPSFVGPGNKGSQTTSHPVVGSTHSSSCVKQLPPPPPPSSSMPQNTSHSGPLRQQNQTACSSAANVQGKFVPKRPSLSVPQNNLNSSVDLQSSRDLFSDADDIDISSVLDGIDSESLFGDF